MEKHRRKFLAGIGLGLATIASQPASAHRGGLNAEGCHNNHKTDDYHCHTAQSPSSRSSATLNSATFNQSSASAEQILSAQTALKALGYDIGDVDGQQGAKTQQALKAFEGAENWPAIGDINDAAIYRLVVVLSEKTAC